MSRVTSTSYSLWLPCAAPRSTSTLSKLAPLQENMFKWWESYWWSGPVVSRLLALWFNTDSNHRSILQFLSNRSPQRLHTVREPQMFWCAVTMPRDCRGTRHTPWWAHDLPRRNAHSEILEKIICAWPRHSVLWILKHRYESRGTAQKYCLYMRSLSHRQRKSRNHKSHTTHKFGIFQVAFVGNVKSDIIS